jgi:tRNA threonylcarbamoyl adenosine modification protein (Sua5/YciO/YrdC/YwlC family)
LPGPYTFVLEGSNLVPKIMLTRRKTVGIRVPDHPICLSLVQGLGHPVISTTVPVSGGTVSMEPSLIHEELGSLIDMVVDGGVVPGGPSSVVSLIDDVPEVIREGLGDISSFL